VGFALPIMLPLLR